MSELPVEYFVESQEEKEQWVIDSDSKAEWALKHIAEAKSETQRLVNVCDTAIAEYVFKKEKYQLKFEKETNNLKAMLKTYFESVPHKESKTQETYELPSGKLKLKRGQIEFVRDNEKLVKYLETNPEHIKFIKIEKIPDWASFKKEVDIKGSEVITKDGEIVDGITVHTKPDTFDIEI
jgi:hypothetical protein